MLTPEEKAAQRQRWIAATERAKAVLKPGDRVSRAMCGGGRGTFTFTRWDGNWACGGRTIMDCPATAIIKVNGQLVDFTAP